MSIYQDIILDHYRTPRNFGRIDKPTQSISLHNPLCGDVIKMDVKLINSILKDIKFKGQGCAISIASASMLTEKAKGKKKEDLIKWDKDFIIKMLGIELNVNRIKCALLPLEALQKILNN